TQRGTVYVRGHALAGFDGTIDARYNGRYCTRYTDCSDCNDAFYCHSFFLVIPGDAYIYICDIHLTGQIIFFEIKVMFVLKRPHICP
ncbi:unnamed protein product, partial [Rotaria sordida]